jgi:hypothetical protein
MRLRGEKTRRGSCEAAVEAARSNGSRRTLARTSGEQPMVSGAQLRRSVVSLEEREEAGDDLSGIMEQEHQTGSCS